MQPEWNLHYFRWVIGDGEPERHIGEIFDWFSLSFWSQGSLVKSEQRAKIATPISDNAYRVVAEVLYISQNPSQEASIIDFGLRAISDSDVLPAGCQPGDYVTGEIALELPLCTKLAPHQLAHKWRVNRISADLTPYVPHSTYGHFVRDSSQLSPDYNNYANALMRESINFAK
jgi:hypothetical protein